MLLYPCLKQTWNGCENGRGRRNRIRHVRDRGRGRKNSLRDCVRDHMNNLRGGDVRGRGRGRRNRIRHVRDDDVRDRGRGRKNRIRRVRGDDVRDRGRGRKNRIRRVRGDDVRGYGRDRKNSLRDCVRGCDHGRRNKCDRDHESGHVHMNKSSFLRSYLSPLFVHQMHNAHFKYFFNMIVVKAVKYMLADLS